MRAKARARKSVTSEKPTFEVSDVSPRLVLFSSAILFGAVGCFILIALWIVYAIAPTQPDRLPADQRAMVGPRLEVSPAADRALLQAQTEARLHQYGWAGTDHLTAHIPIDRAMALLSAKGWPDVDRRRAEP